MDNRWSLKKWLLQLSAPYKKSEVYKTYGETLGEKQKESVFWDPEINYVLKHEPAKLRGASSSAKNNNEVKRLVKTKK